MSNVQENIGEKALKAGVWYTISSIALKCASIITTPLFARFLSTENFGIVSNFTSWHSLISIFCTLSLSYSVGRAKIDYPEKLDKYIGSMQTLSVIITAVITGVMVAFLEPVSDFMELTPALCILMCIYLLLGPVTAFAQNGFRYTYKYKENVAISIYTTVFTIGLSFLFIFLMPQNLAFARSLGIALPAILLGIFFWIRGIKNRSVCINTEFWKYGLKLSLPLVVHTMSLNILAQSDKMMITKFCGSSDNGIYSLAYSYALLINLIIGAANEAWLPWFHDTYHMGNYNEIKQKVKPFITLECMMGVGCIALAPEAILILGGAEYSSGAYAVAPIVVGVLCQYVYTHYVNVQMTLKKTGYVSVGTVFAAALNIVLNLIFIPMFGFVAAAYTTLAGYLCLMLIHYLINKFIMKSDIYDNKFMFGAVAVVALAAFGFVMLYETIVIRYAVLAIICIAYLVLNRAFIAELLSKFFKKK